MRRGESAGIPDPAPNHVHCVDEGQAVRVLVRLLCRLVQEMPHGIVGQHQAFDLLADQRRRLAAQDRVAAQQVGLDLVVGALDLPALVIQRSELGGRGLERIEPGRQLAVGRLVALGDAVFDHPRGEPAEMVFASRYHV